jgi:hypothetical protein
MILTQHFTGLTVGIACLSTGPFSFSSLCCWDVWSSHSLSASYSTDALSMRSRPQSRPVSQSLRATRVAASQRAATYRRINEGEAANVG